VVPGAADRIIQMAEKQAAHRQSIEQMEAKIEARDSLLGILFAFILGIGSIVACIVVVLTVRENAGAIAGSLLGVTGIGSIVTAFLKTTRRTNDK
jgi:Predicted membrane protein